MEINSKVVPFPGHCFANLFLHGITKQPVHCIGSSYLVSSWCAETSRLGCAENGTITWVFTLVRPSVEHVECWRCCVVLNPLAEIQRKVDKVVRLPNCWQHPAGYILKFGSRLLGLMFWWEVVVLYRVGPNNAPPGSAPDIVLFQRGDTHPASPRRAVR